MCRLSRSDSGTEKTASSQPSPRPAAGGAKIRPSPSARISRRRRGQRVAGGAVATRRLEQAAALEPGDRARTAGSSTPSSASSRTRAATQPAAASRAYSPYMRDDERPGCERLPSDHSVALDRRHEARNTDARAFVLTVVQTRAPRRSDHAARPRRRTSTRSAATTCRRSTSGRSCSSTCPTCSTPTGSTARPSCSTRPSSGTAPTGRCLVVGATGEAWTLRRPAPAHANQIAHVLVDDLGLVPGNRVLLRGPNNPWLVACWFAVLKAGGVVVTTMPLLRPGELRDDRRDRPRSTCRLCDHRFVDDLATAGIGRVDHVRRRR